MLMERYKLSLLLSLLLLLALDWLCLTAPPEVPIPVFTYNGSKAGVVARNSKFSCRAASQSKSNIQVESDIVKDRSKLYCDIGESTMIWNCSINGSFVDEETEGYVSCVAEIEGQTKACAMCDDEGKVYLKVRNTSGKELSICFLYNLAEVLKTKALCTFFEILSTRYCIDGIEYQN